MADVESSNKVHAYKLVALRDLVPYERNPRIHSDEQIAQLCASIREFGFTNPLLIDEQSPPGIIAGHGRYLAAKALGRAEVPAIVVSGLSAQQRRALVIADNQLAMNAGWDPDLLRSEIELLLADEYPIDLVGFSDAELARIIAEPTAIDLETEWANMPEFRNEAIAYRSLIVHFETDEAVQAFAALIKQEIGERTKSAWFPPKARERLADKGYVSSEAEPS